VGCIGLALKREVKKATCRFTSQSHKNLHISMDDMSLMSLGSNRLRGEEVIPVTI
jgi:hypothetical protein